MRACAHVSVRVCVPSQLASPPPPQMMASLPQMLRVLAVELSPASKLTKGEGVWLVGVVCT